MDITTATSIAAQRQHDLVTEAARYRSVANPRRIKGGNLFGRRTKH
ncbi:hypothetical protein [Solihabitans fulvus]|nr:hypothetical protein [Solihabitans fulvus]